MQQQSPAYLPICIAQMQRPGGPVFVNGVNGQVDYITQFEPEYCRHGDTYSWYKLQMCCPGESALQIIFQVLFIRRDAAVVPLLLP